MADDNELVSPSKFMMVLIDPTTVLDNTNNISATSSSQRRRRTPRVSAKNASITSIRTSSRRTSATSKSKRTRKLIAASDQSSSTTVAVDDDATATTEAKRICKPCCDKCHRQFSSRYCLKKHVENNRCLIKWSCGKCDNEFTTRDLLRAHVRNEHIECKWNDDEESAFANANDNIREKTEVVEDIKARQCDLCEKTYPSKRLMLEHRRRVHTGKSRERYVDDKTMELIVSRSVIDEFGLVILKCDHCGYCSENRYRFLEHYRIHTGEKPFICYHCDKSFRTKVFLKKHIMFVHQGVKNFPCDICGQAFSDRRFVESHRRIHTGERPFVCDICGKTFTQGATLLMHTRFHLNVRNYQCDLCDKKFFRRGHLQVHLKRHNNIKDYVCHQCGKAFVENKMLRDHEVVHSEDRPFSCEICRATFKLKKHLIQHGRTHKNRRSGWNRHNIITSSSSSHSSDQPSPSDMLVSPDCPNAKEKYSCIGIKLEPRTHDWESSHLSRSALSNENSAEDDVTSEDDETQCNVDDSDDDDELSIQTMSAETSSRCDRRFKCEKCRKTFVRRATYWRHLAEKHNRVNIADVEPNEAVRKIVEATSTLKVKLECAEDDQNVESDDRITNDAMKLSDKEDGELFCGTCAKSYPTSQKLKRHIRQVHGNKSKVHQNLKDFCSKFAISDGFLLCDMCSFRCNQFRRHRFMEHYRIHNGEKPHKCGVCGRACRTTSILNKHIRTVHFDCKLYVCDVCGKSFSERRNMEEHIRIHTGDKPFVCDLCGSRFTQQSSLVSHKKSHENRRSYQCDVCKATFNTNSVMVRHIRNTHSKEKPHRCDQCDKGFSDKDLLNRHKTVHSQETPFSCKLCGARFKLKRYLQQHDRIHQRRA